MIKQHAVADLHLAQVVARLEVSHSGPISSAVAHEIIPRIGFWLLFDHPQT
jgi:hypothetical protein